ncbi:transmembrane protein fend-like [Pollicipes pollicipes]|uniref:transmembrane protein fend-like n=1 Tax=Pollicipes pollicipes TaxID=41117 RepID=UPI001884D63C|nr:transmembrane protein fend-like [Pollicipes pollicipes]
MWSSVVTAALLLALAAVARARGTDEVAALTTAQCRATCLDELTLETPVPFKWCSLTSACLTCWDRCGSLRRAPDARRSACRRLPYCDAGCRLACQFLAAPPAAPPPRSRRPPQLELSVDGGEVRWRMEGAPPDNSVVYLLLARADDIWEEVVQTPERSVAVNQLPAGTPLRLLAVARWGQLAAADAVFQPSETPRPSEAAVSSDARRPAEVPEYSEALESPEVPRRPQDGGQRLDAESFHAQVPAVWPLETISLGRVDNMVLAEISWEPLTRARTEYLVTWEVSGGGIKGHLYTDMTAVTLSLWPESVYKIQVEMMSPGLPRSEPLVISTYSEAAGRQPSPPAPVSAQHVQQKPVPSPLLEASVAVRHVPEPA